MRGLRKKMGLDEAIEGEIREKNPTAEAVTHLLSVKKRLKGEPDTDIELKTDLSENDVKIHTAVDLMASFLSMDDNQFVKTPIISELVNKKERKLLSKDRKSRQEIVDVARQPDMFMDREEVQKQSMMKRFFTSRKQN